MGAIFVSFANACAMRFSTRRQEASEGMGYIPLITIKGPRFDDGVGNGDEDDDVEVEVEVEVDVVV